RREGRAAPRRGRRALMAPSEPYVEPWTPARRFLCLAMKASRTGVECSTLRRLHDELGSDAAARLAAEHRAEPIVAHGLAEAGLAEGGTDYGLDADGETYAIDLQWRAVSGRWLRADQEPSADELIARSTVMPGTAARMLAPVDNLLQVALHTAKHSYCRAPGFRLHLDVDRVVHGQKIDWDAVVEMVRRLGVGTAVFLSLSIPRGLFGTPVPPEVLGALAPAPARRAMLYRWLRSVSVFEPERPKFTRATQLL